tara:strand:- start:1201 stop:1371 length:171 start_codon:yes stop_codon:yes gene_type:complete
MRLVLVVVRKVIVVVIVLVKLLMIKNYISWLEVVFIHRFGKEEVVLELRSLNRMIP